VDTKGAFNEFPESSQERYKSLYSRRTFT